MNRSIYNHAECFMRRFKLKISASGTCQNNQATPYIVSSVIVWTHIAYFTENVATIGHYNLVSIQICVEIAYSGRFYQNIFIALYSELRAETM